MDVTFAEIVRGREYGRKHLAQRWGYASYHAIARGVVTPAGHNKIVLFITQEKQVSAFPYKDRIEERLLHWEGPTDGFAEDRIIRAGKAGDEIHVFYRKKHHQDFTYLGEVVVESFLREPDKPTRFVLRTN